MVHQSPDLKDLERGIPLANFEEAVKERELDMEFRVLTRLNCHKLHYMNLFKSQLIDFKSKNRYNEILPFKHCRVELSREIGSGNNLSSYINASYVNVQ